MARSSHLTLRWLVMSALLMFFASAQARPYGDIEQQRIDKTFPQHDGVSAPEGRFKVRTVSAAGKPIGYVFQSLDVLAIPAYSGKPINTLVILDTAGVIRDAYVLEHHEPILLIGIPEVKLHEFTAHYAGVDVRQRVVVGRSSDPKAVTVDAIAGATVTAMVVNEGVMRAAREVAVSLKLIDDKAATAQKVALIRSDVFAPATWAQLTGNGAIRRLLLTRGQVDAAFKDTAAEAGAAPDETFIDLYVADINPPSIGRNLLGDAHYRNLMQALKPGEQAIAVLGRGLFSFKGSGYVRGGIFDRVQLRQFGNVISFRDLDHRRIDDAYAEGMPAFDEMSIFIVRAQAGFDPGSAWTLELLVRRQTGPVSGTFSSFELPYQLPEQYLERPLPTAAEQAAKKEIEEAYVFADESPYPDISAVTEDMYSQMNDRCVAR